ncbi:MAG TPA: hypothetical protein VFZ09_04850 [Archangium sp.]|uniref:hypothetical protein n=1 Tax=Archangium sp. TaxID=1872627 RepID=UPI002E378B5A|nr:hypothetical protein [Archangium sp.]HEX5745551.1 hypothetical protein [Archangium sp.]
MNTRQLLKKLSKCPAGQDGWKEFEDICIKILQALFVPPLSKPHIQSRTQSGTDRRDAIFPNRMRDHKNAWGLIHLDHEAKYIPFEFKNYDKQKVTKEDVEQIKNYLTSKFGRLAFLCTRTIPGKSAHIKRNAIYSEEKKIIIFLEPRHLIEMVDLKERGQDPADLLLDLIDAFMFQHE